MPYEYTPRDKLVRKYIRKECEIDEKKGKPNLLMVQHNHILNEAILLLTTEWGEYEDIINQLKNKKWKCIDTDKAMMVKRSERILKTAEMNADLEWGCGREGGVD